MSLLGYLIGRPLGSGEEATQRVGVSNGVAVFGLDALGSAAYGPEAALTILLPAGMLGLPYILPLSAAVVVLLLLVFLSYRQIIEAYPAGGGAYTVARASLGAEFGVVAGAALMLDYLLNVSVGISTGVGALVSAVPSLQRETLPLCLAILAVLIVVNLRGTRESGLLWSFPTAGFVLCLMTVIGIGLVRTLISGGHPTPLETVRHPAPVQVAVTGWLLLRSFASGCTALTGVEAVSNGVQVFREPKILTAKRTLTLIVALLAVMLLGVGILIHAYGITATEPGRAGYQSVLSMLTQAVMGRGWFYYVTISFILVMLSLSANTSFAGFPQLCRIMADDGYLPKPFRLRGRRLVYTAGILVLGAISAGVLIMFGGITDRLIPLFAIGAFLAFTFSQWGMVRHWRRSEQPHARLHLAINTVGAIATGATTVLVLIAKFTSGAWLTMALLLPLVLLMRAIHRHYEQAEKETRISSLELDFLSEPPLMLLPIDRWNRASLTALRFACTLHGEVRVLHVNCDGDDDQSMEDWRKMLSEAAARSGLASPKLIAICSQYRAITGPLFRYVLQAERENPERTIAVVFPELVAARWYQQALHNYRAIFLKTRLLFGGRRRIAIVDVPWQLSSSA
jgi:amino acid transporter